MVQVDRAFGVSLLEHTADLNGNIQNLFHTQVAHKVSARVASITQQIEVVFPAAFQDQKSQPAVLEAFLELVDHILDLVQSEERECTADGGSFTLLLEELGEGSNFRRPDCSRSRLQVAGLQHGCQPVQTVQPGENVEFFQEEGLRVGNLVVTHHLKSRVRTKACLAEGVFQQKDARA